MYFTLNLILATYLVSIIKTYLKYYFTTKQNIYYSCCGNCYSVCFTILKSTFNFFNSILGLSPSTHTQRFNYLKIISNWLIILFFFSAANKLLTICAYNYHSRSYHILSPQPAPPKIHSVIPSLSHPYNNFTFSINRRSSIFRGSSLPYHVSSNLFPIYLSSLFAESSSI